MAGFEADPDEEESKEPPGRSLIRVSKLDELDLSGQVRTISQMER